MKMGFSNNNRGFVNKGSLKDSLPDIVAGPAEPMPSNNELLVEYTGLYHTAKGYHKGYHKDPEDDFSAGALRALIAHRLYSKYTDTRTPPVIGSRLIIKGIEGEIHWQMRKDLTILCEPFPADATQQAGAKPFIMQINKCSPFLLKEYSLATVVVSRAWGQRDYEDEMLKLSDGSEESAQRIEQLDKFFSEGLVAFKTNLESWMAKYGLPPAPPKGTPA